MYDTLIAAVDLATIQTALLSVIAVILGFRIAIWGAKKIGSFFRA